MVYDTIIIGGGPAGLTAGIYSSRAGLRTLLLEGAFTGGQAATTNLIENYPGFPQGINGAELGMQMEEQARRFCVIIKSELVLEVSLQGEFKQIKTSKETYEAKTVIIAAGARARKLAAQNEERLTGMGVSYCATCDGAFYIGKPVAVIGGGDTAVGDALYLSRISKPVYLIHRRDELRAAKSIQEAALKSPNVKPIWNTVVESFEGETSLTSIRLKNVLTNEISSIDVNGAFVAVGTDPQTKLFEGQLQLENGCIKTDLHMRTEIPGVFAAGDVRFEAFRQVITAAADGAYAATSAAEYICSL